MSEIRVNKLINEAGTGKVELTQGASLPIDKTIDGAGGVNVSGACTASAGFVGNLTGNVTGNADTATTTTGNAATATVANGLTNTPNITVGVVNAASGTVSGNWTVGGTLTYEDVNNVDSVGLITARNGLNVLAGVTSMTGGVRYNGGGSLREKVNITAGKLSDNLQINLADGMVHYFSVAETGTSTPNIRVDASTSLNSELEIGEQVSVTIVTTAASAGYSANWTVDGNAVTEIWNGGSAPTSGGASGKDFYTFNIIKTGNDAWLMFSNVSNFA